MKNSFPVSATTEKPRVPFLIKCLFTAFMAVLVPVYLKNYGPTNFLYFCDVALILTLIGVWTENRLLISMCAVGILIPQGLWVVDFLVQLTGHTFTGMTAYMFDERRSLFLRGLSFFHGWLPFLLVYLLAKLGYDRRALPAWTALAWALCLVCFFFLPPAGANLPDPNTPVNVDYVYGFTDSAPQTWLPTGVFLAVWMMVLPVLAYLPTNFVLRKLFGAQPPAIGLEDAGESLLTEENADERG